MRWERGVDGDRHAEVDCGCVETFVLVGGVALAAGERGQQLFATATITSLTLAPVVQVPGLSQRGFDTLAILMVVVGGYAIKKGHRMRSAILQGFQ